MKCLKQGLLVVLLICLVGSPLFAGWDVFRNVSSESSMESLDISKETPEETPQEQPQTSSTEEETESPKTENVSESYEEKSESYDEKLDEVKEVLDEAEKEVVEEKSERKAEKKKAAIEEAKVIVDELVASKEALDENYNILADLALSQMKEIKHLERQEDFKFGLGLVFGYKWLDTMTLGFGTHFLFNETWDVGIEATYDVHALGGLDQFKNPRPENVEVRVGVTRYF